MVKTALDLIHNLKVQQDQIMEKTVQGVAERMIMVLVLQQESAAGNATRLDILK